MKSSMPILLTMLFLSLAFAMLLWNPQRELSQDVLTFIGLDFLAPEGASLPSEFPVAQRSSRTCQRYGGEFDVQGPVCRFEDGTICSGEKVADRKCMLSDGTSCDGRTYVQTSCR